MARDYKDEYKKFQSSIKDKLARAGRNRRRTKAEDEGRVHKWDKNDIHHFSKGGKIVEKVMPRGKNRGLPEKSRLKGSNRK
tara:strand:- start:89 stop:331 length:243 start_codon:yes stop_codon:yes gene_type:complete